MSKEQEVIECANKIKNYCDDIDAGCVGCKFDKEDGSCSLKGIPLEWEIPKFKLKLTDDEKAIIKALTGYYQYIARDECGTLYVYKRRPEKKIIDGMLSQFLILKMAMY